MRAPGDSFAHYQIEALLGPGGMGEVYRAFDTKLHRRVALKLLLAPEMTSKRGLTQRRYRAHAVGMSCATVVARIFEREKELRTIEAR